MKRLSLLLAACAVVSVTAAQAQCVSTSPAQTTVLVPATPLAGTILVEDTGARTMPSGVNELGRYARFIGDHRLLSNEIEFKNRDFQAWKPIYAPSSRALMSNNLRGLGAGTNTTSAKRVAVRSVNLAATPIQLYF